MTTESTTDTPFAKRLYRELATMTDEQQLDFLGAVQWTEAETEVVVQYLLSEFRIEALQERMSRFAPEQDTDDV